MEDCEWCPAVIVVVVVVVFHRRFDNNKGIISSTLCTGESVGERERVRMGALVRWFVRYGFLVQ